MLVSFGFILDVLEYKHLGGNAVLRIFLSPIERRKPDHLLRMHPMLPLFWNPLPIFPYYGPILLLQPTSYDYGPLFVLSLFYRASIMRWGVACFAPVPYL